MQKHNLKAAGMLAILMVALLGQTMSSQPAKAGSPQAKATAIASATGSPLASYPYAASSYNPYAYPELHVVAAVNTNDVGVVGFNINSIVRH